MTLAIMQPYIFPYLGYFQLIKAVDTFVLYDDVNFITRGWINSNSILLNGRPHPFTVPCRHASQNRLIHDTEVVIDAAFRTKLMKMFEHAYKKAPSYAEVEPMLQTAFGYEERNLAAFIAHSLTIVCSYLRIGTPLVRSSELYASSRGMEKADRLIAIAKAAGADSYINSPGGQALYDKEYFRSHGVELSFIKPELPPYEQFTTPFVPNLSIIDIMMFTARERAIGMLDSYTLV